MSIVHKRSNLILRLALAIFITLSYLCLKEVVAAWVILDNVIEFNRVIVNFVLVITAILELALVLLLSGFSITKRKWRLFEETGIYALKVVVISIILGLGFVFIQEVLNHIYNSAFGSSFNIVFDIQLNNLLSWDVMAVILIIPISEEIVFRRCIQAQLYEQMTSYLSILASSILFAIMHSNLVQYSIGDGNITWHHMWITFFGGVVAAVLYHRFRRVIFPIVFHVCWNFGVTVFAM